MVEKKTKKAAAPAATQESEQEEQLNDDSDECSPDFFYYDVVLVGAGATGVGVTHALLRGGLDPTKILMIEKGSGFGTSFRQWHKTTRFISPSFPGYPFGNQDLNAVVPDTAVHSKSHYPTGDEYAAYLERLMETTGICVNFGNAVTSIEEVNGKFVIGTKEGFAVIATNVVWCGGEWNSPNMPIDDKLFSKNDIVHYKDADVDKLVDGVMGTDDPIVLVGGGEAGADLGCALVDRGVKVLIVESSSNKVKEEGEKLDPSRRLSAVTQERLARAGDRLEFRTGTKCVGVKRDGDRVVVSLASVATTNGRGMDDDVTAVTTRAKVVMCTGFDASRNSVIKPLFLWKDGSPRVTPRHDMSYITKGMFIAGPMIVHRIDSACPTKGSLDDLDTPTVEEVIEASDTKDDDKKNNIIFCFIYKYRTRFPVVAGEVIKRVIMDRHLVSRRGGNRSVAKIDHVLSSDGQKLFNRCRKMLEFYMSRGMMLVDLSCSQLACGMTICNTFNYDIDETTAEEECKDTDASSGGRKQHSNRSSILET